MSTGRDVRFKNIHMNSTGIIYFGDKVDNEYPNGTWKICLSGNDLVVYRKESGSWVEKGAFAP